jgi:outer membrane lipoprotein-sorting protein
MCLFCDKIREASRNRHTSKAYRETYLAWFHTIPARPAASGRIYLKFVPMRIRQALAAGLIALAPALTGCLTHVRSVPKTRPADVVMNATLDQLLKQVNTRFDAIQTVTATVDITFTTGGGLQGKETQYPSFGGYIFVRKPEDLRVLLRLPLLGSQAFDMVSDGKTWKLWIPPRKIARTGTSEVTDPSQHGLESLRPSVIFDSLLVRGLDPNQIVSLTSDTRVIENEKKKKDLIEEPDYDLEILEQPKGETAHTLRVIHISRSNLLPYQQDIYDRDGNIVTRAFYSNYQTFSDTPFPMKIEIKRPLDQYSLSIAITKLTLNQKLDDDQFELKIPEGVPIKDMN